MRLPFKSPWTARVGNLLRQLKRPKAAETVAPFPFRATQQWDDAFSRVESYLRAHHIGSRIVTTELTTEIIKAARKLAQELPAEPPVTLAMQITQARLGEWLVASMGTGDWTDQRVRAKGRLALYVSNVSKDEPAAVCRADALPDSIARKFRSVEIQPTPELDRVTMPPSVLEFELADMVERRWTTFSRSVFFKASAGWMVIAGVGCLTWFAMH